MNKEANTICWNELYSEDVATTAEFYSSLFGWSVNKMTGATGEEYIEFKLGDVSVAGMLEIKPEWGGVPPHWAVYFSVENCDATIESAKSLGGSIESEIMEVPGMARFVVVQDPQGAHFLIMESLAVDNS